MIVFLTLFLSPIICFKTGAEVIQTQSNSSQIRLSCSFTLDCEEKGIMCFEKVCELQLDNESLNRTEVQPSYYLRRQNTTHFVLFSYGPSGPPIRIRFLQFRIDAELPPPSAWCTVDTKDNQLIDESQPIFQSNLREGALDGFLPPCMVRCDRLEKDCPKFDGGLSKYKNKSLELRLACDASTSTGIISELLGSMGSEVVAEHTGGFPSREEMRPQNLNVWYAPFNSSGTDLALTISWTCQGAWLRTPKEFLLTCVFLNETASEKKLTVAEHYPDAYCLRSRIESTADFNRCLLFWRLWRFTYSLRLAHSQHNLYLGASDFTKEKPARVVCMVQAYVDIDNEPYTVDESLPVEVDLSYPEVNFPAVALFYGAKEMPIVLNPATGVVETNFVVSGPFHLCGINHGKGGRDGYRASYHQTAPGSLIDENEACDPTITGIIYSPMKMASGGYTITARYMEEVRQLAPLVSTKKPLQLQITIYRELFWTEEVEDRSFQLFRANTTTEVFRKRQVFHKNSPYFRLPSKALGTYQIDWENVSTIFVSDEGIAEFIHSTHRVIQLLPKDCVYRKNLSAVYSVAASLTSVFYLTRELSGLFSSKKITTHDSERNIFKCETRRVHPIRQYPMEGNMGLTIGAINKDMTPIKIEAIGRKYPLAIYTRPNFSQCIRPERQIIASSELGPDGKYAEINLKFVRDISTICYPLIDSPLKLRIQYTALEKGKNCNVSRPSACEKKSCACYSHVLNCTEAFHAVVHNDPSPATLPRLEFSTFYHVEITAYFNPARFRKLQQLLALSQDQKIPSKFSAQFCVRTIERPKKDILATVLPSALVGILLLLVTLMFIYWYLRRGYIYRILPYISPRQMKLGEELGSGHFGTVHEGTYRGKKVAIKVLRNQPSDRHQKDFVHEALFLGRLKHPNIIRCLGIAHGNKRGSMIVMELMDGGSLQRFLRREAVRDGLCAADLVQMLIWVAKACAYLEGKRIVHRDLSARNCLVKLLSKASVKPRTVKLTDFGLAESVREGEGEYVSCTARSLPVSHTPPEGLANGRFVLESDVWSFGVLVWEVGSWGERPYGDTPLWMVKQWAIEDKATENLLEDLEEAQDWTREIIEKCLAFYPEQRPTFSEKGEKASILTMLNAARSDVTLHKRNDPPCDQENDSSGLMQLNPYSEEDAAVGDIFSEGYSSGIESEGETEDVEMQSLTSDHRSDGY